MKGMKTLRKTRVARILVLALACMLAMAPLSAHGDGMVPRTPKASAIITLEKLLSTQTDKVWPNLTQFSFVFAPHEYTYDDLTTLTEPYQVYTKADMPMPDGAALGQPMQVVITGFTQTEDGNEQRNDSTLGEIIFDQMGVYTYTIKERIPGTTDVIGTVAGEPIPSLQYDTNTYYVNVYVENVLDADTGSVITDDGGKALVTIAGISVYRGENEINGTDTGPSGADTKNPERTDDGKVEIVIPDPGDDTTSSVAATAPLRNLYENRALEVSKQVAGGLAETNREFTMNVTLKKPESDLADTFTYNYKIYNFGSDDKKGGGDDEELTVLAGTITGTANISLKHQQYFVIEGLPLGEKVTVTEVDDSATGYKTDIEYEHGDDEDSETEKTTGRTVGEKVIAGDVNTQDFLNTMESTTPTGVWMNILPYGLILLVVVGAGLFYFASKRKVKEKSAGKESGL